MGSTLWWARVGYGLSGGQAQRVSIARAFLKNAPVLLLDEPTAHLDPATEGEVLESLRHLAIGRTVVLASHASAAHAFPPAAGWICATGGPCRRGGRHEAACCAYCNLWRHRWPWLAFGLVVSLASVGVGVALLAVAGAHVAVLFAGSALAAGALLQALGPLRVVLRYYERLATHAATFRALADLRVWFFRGLARRSAGGARFPARRRRGRAPGQRRGGAGRAVPAHHRAAGRGADAAAGAGGAADARRRGGLAARRGRRGAVRDRGLRRAGAGGALGRCGRDASGGSDGGAAGRRGGHADRAARRAGLRRRGADAGHDPGAGGHRGPRPPWR